MAGTWEDDTTTFFAGPNSKNLRVIFDSPWTDGKIEMVFGTVCRFSIAGWQDGCKDEFVSKARFPMEMELDGINWIIPSNDF